MATHIHQMNNPNAVAPVIAPWPTFSNGYIAHVILERQSAILDRLADARQLDGAA